MTYPVLILAGSLSLLMLGPVSCVADEGWRVWVYVAAGSAENYTKRDYLLPTEETCLMAATVLMGSIAEDLRRDGVSTTIDSTGRMLTVVNPTLHPPTGVMIGQCYPEGVDPRASKEK